MSSSAQPEGTLPPDQHYSVEEANAYTGKSRIQQIQTELTARAIELLELPTSPSKPLILDIGCGSGLSGEVLTEAGYNWVGMDVAPAMLQCAQEMEVEGDLLLADIGQRQSFREGVFDGAISISVVQWLCHAFHKDQDPRRRLKVFFRWLYNSLAKGARAVLQFYPSHQQQADMIGKAAHDAGFVGGFVVDHPDSEKKKKIFLLLSVGVPEAGSVMASGGGGSVSEGSSKKGKKDVVTRKQWVIKKKEQQRQRGKEVRADSKYTARKRKRHAV